MNNKINQFFNVTQQSKKRIITLPDDITTKQLMQIDLGYNYSNKELIEDWNRLKTITKFKSGSQWKPGLKICKQFGSKFCDIKATNGKSFNSIKSDYDEMDKIREWGRTKMSKLYVSWLRRAIYMRWGGHNPTYYRPHLAKQIILSTGKSNGILFDPCAGWGGRMLGTAAAGWKYISCEPNEDTYKNLLKIIEFTGIENNIDLHNIPCEEFDMNNITEIDIILTSPPYFNLETYSNNKTQSYIKFSSFDDWLENWLLKIIEDCVGILKKDGLSCWNVMDFKNTKIVDAIINKHNSLGYELINAIGIDSPFVNYKKSLNKKDLTYIFKLKR